MARKGKADELTKLIADLRRERKEHLDALARIDATFARFGIDAGAMEKEAPARGRRKKTGARKATGRKKTSKRAAKKTTAARAKMPTEPKMMRL